MSSNSTMIYEWEDAPENDRDADDWPYPTKHILSLITGDLANLIRERLGQSDENPVFFIENVVSGGYSEYTQEEDYYHTIMVGSVAIEMGESYDSGIRALLKWLDKA